MKVVYLAGGVGKRMSPLTKEKFLYRFLGKELILHHIDMARAAGLNDFVIVGNRENVPKLAKVLGDTVDYAIQESPIGMHDAVLSAEKFLRGQDEILIVNPNDVVAPEAYSMIAGSEGSSLLGYHVSEYFPGGYLVVEDGHVHGMVEKPGEGNEPSKLVNIVVHKHGFVDLFLDRLAETSSERDDIYEVALDGMFKDGYPYKAVDYDGPWSPIKYPWHILNVMEHFLGTAQRVVPESTTIAQGAQIIGDVMLGEGVRIFENAVIKGPAYIGDGSIIGNNAMVLNSHIGKKCVVGFGTEIKHSYIEDECWFHHNYVGDSIISSGCSMGYGGVTANFRLDEANVSVSVTGDKVDTGTDKLGVIMAPDVKVGVNACIMPGVRLGEGSRVGPGAIQYYDMDDKGSFYVEY